MNGVATVVAFGFYAQSYLSILSIKDDCVSREFVASANLAAVEFAGWFLGCGALALLAIASPAAVGIGRNYLRWRKGHNVPPLQPGQEFDGWSEFQVKRVASWQKCLVLTSSSLFFLLILTLMFSAIGGNPEGVRAEWHNFEVRCLQKQPLDQGLS
jgi:hypothetical protein